MRSVFDDSGFSFIRLGPWFAKVFGSLFLLLMQMMCAMVYFIEQCFWVLAVGFQKEGTGGSSPKEYYSIIDILLFGKNNVSGALKSNSAITNIVIFMMLLGIALTIVAMLISLIRSQLSTKDEESNPKQTIIGVIKAFVLIIAVPFIVFTGIKLLNVVTASIMGYANMDTTAQGSLANRFFFMFGNTTGTKVPLVDETGCPKFSFLFNDSDILAIKKIAGRDIKDETLFVVLQEIGFLSSGGIDCYQFLVAYLAIIALGWGFIRCLMILAKRIFDVTILYVLAPLSIASYPSDDGKRYGVWKDLMVAKIITSLGIILGYLIYSIFISELSSLFRNMNNAYFGKISLNLANNQAFQGIILTVVYIIISISGAIALPATYQLVASLVSESAGRQAQADFQNMEHGLHDVSGFTKKSLGVAGAIAFGSKKGGSSSSGNRTKLYSNQFTKGALKCASSLKHRGLIGSSWGAFWDGHQKSLSKTEERLRKQAIENFGTSKGKYLNKQLENMGSKAVDAKEVANHFEEQRKINDVLREHHMSQPSPTKQEEKIDKKINEKYEQYLKDKHSTKIF